MSDNEKPLVFCIGLVKTGTTSLLRALNTLGWPGCNDIPLMDEAWATWRKNLGMTKIIPEPFDTLVGKYRAFAQNPVSLNWQKLFMHYPEAKYILTVRDINDVIASMMINVAYNRRHPNPEQVAARWKHLNSQQDEQFYEEHARKVQDRFFGASSVSADPVTQSLLVMDISKGDGWDKLCPFLGVDKPDLEFPHHNSSREKLLEMIAWGTNFSSPDVRVMEQADEDYRAGRFKDAREIIKDLEVIDEEVS
jgi:hypothetical protein